MGYNTELRGGFQISPKVKPEHVAYINAFAKSRRMQFDVSKLATMDDPIREAVGLPVGEQGKYFVGNPGNYGEGEGDHIVDHNSHPEDQPGLWCQWIIKDNILQWDGDEKFYEYVKWLHYLLDNFFIPWGYTLTGSVRWRGEDFDDLGTIVVTDNKVDVKGSF